MAFIGMRRTVSLDAKVVHEKACADFLLTPQNSPMKQKMRLLKLAL